MENYSQGTFRIEADGPSPRLSPTEQKINAHDNDSELSEESAAWELILKRTSVTFLKHKLMSAL